MTYRTIMIFPEFDNGEEIQKIRKEYDPLADLVPYHITLVFPFDEPDLSNQALSAFLAEKLNSTKPFYIRFKGLSQEDSYLFLDCLEAAKKIRDLHDWLYEGTLSKQLRSDIPYKPHITVGHCQDIASAKNALSNLQIQQELEFKGWVDRISVEEIGPNDESLIILEHKL